ncbi:MAG: hypothetical protein FWF87_07170 [Synergistaceae bacterium]|nr:hypothetical protein [Synergistaceae bacterium]
MPDNLTVCPKCGAADYLRKIVHSAEALSSLNNAQFTPRDSVTVNNNQTPKDSLTTYKIWAPDDSLWTEWAKPVLFANFTSWKDNSPLVLPEINWLTRAQRDTIIIIDLPGKTGVEESLALARFGLRPVPLYNGVNNEKSSMLVNVGDVADALYKGVYVLEKLRILNDSPPVFMLDSNRMISDEKIPGWYDNRWCIFPQDMPSASFLSGRRISKVIVRTNKVQDDLLHILYRYQKQKMKIMRCAGEDIVDLIVEKPSRFKSMLYRFKVIFGLTRNAVGGFGGKIPAQSSGEDSEGRYGYGFG